VEDHLVDLPEVEDFKGPSAWSWEDGEDKEVKRFKVMRPGSRAEVDRLKAEVEALHKQVADLERQMGKTPKPAPTKTK
jgi:polyhydroxyalkanoate synthesis regulator phasin